MRLSSAFLLTAASVISADTVGSSTKRGLVFVPSTNHPSDNQIWVEGKSDLTWYYNYQPSPSPAYANRTQEEFEFVPMLWTTSNTFMSTIQSMISDGRNITHVLTYNEPDGTTSTGGSDIDPAVAATNWISQVEPLRKLGIKVSAPAVTGSPGGFTWLDSFFNACYSQGTNCTADFFPVHWYANFEGLASHLGQVAAAYPGKPIWVTEFSLENADLNDTQNFFNTSIEYLDRLNYTTRYSWFGSFRSDVSNVGPNSAMLDSKGQLTDIGSWYLGGNSTGNIPSSTGAAPKNLASFALAAVFATVAGLALL